MSGSGGDMQGGRDDRSITEIIWSGHLSPRHFKTPGSIKTITGGFVILVYAYLFMLLRSSSRPAAHIGLDVTEVVVRDCYVSVGRCQATTTERFIAVPDASFNGTLLIDGSGTGRCNEALCLDDFALRRSPLTITVSNAVVDLMPIAAVSRAFGLATVPFAVSVRSPPNATLTTSKVFAPIAPSFAGSGLEVNVTTGVVVFATPISAALPSAANTTTTTTIRATVGFGSVLINYDASRVAVAVDATVKAGAYCVAQAAAVTDAGTAACTATTATTLSGPTECRRYNVAHVGNATMPATAAQAFIVSASSVYVSDVSANATSPRIGGPAMDEPPTLSPATLSAINRTTLWEAQFRAGGDYVQAIEVATPGIGLLYMHSKQRVTMEVRPEWLAFFSAFALRVQYRRLITPLSHYRCPASAREVFDDPGTLTAPIVSGSSVDWLDFESGTFGLDLASYGGYRELQLRSMLESFFSPIDQAHVAQSIQETANVPSAIVVFTAPDREFNGHAEMAGTQWKSYALSFDVDGGATIAALTPAVTTTVLVWLAVATALFMTAGVIIAVARQRRGIVKSIMLVDERDLLRNMVSYRRPCPYMMFAGILQVASWLAFRICKFASENATWPSRDAPFSRFLSYFFEAPEVNKVGSTAKKSAASNKSDADADDAAAAAAPKFRALATTVVYEQYQRWAVLRYSKSDISNRDMDVGFDQFGSRRYEEPKLIVRGLRTRKDIDPKAKFKLQYNALQNFYVVTGAPSDFVMMDDIFDRAIASGADIDGEAALVRKLRQWRFEVISDEYEVAYGIMPSPSVATALTEQNLGPTVAVLESFNFSYPSMAFVEWNTTGAAAKWKRVLMFLAWIVIEDVLVTVVTFLPPVIAYFATSPLEIEHARFATSSSTITGGGDLFLSATSFDGARASNVLSMAVWCFMILYLFIMAIEPLLVLATFKIVGDTSVKPYHPQRILLYVRVALASVAIAMYAIAILFVVTFVFLLCIWWVLGSVIQPNRMLVYASSVLTTLFVIGKTLTSLDSMRKQALERLKARILDEMLKLVRSSPAANLFDRFKSEKVAVDTGDGVIAHVTSTAAAPTVTSGTILDAVGDDRAKQSQAVDIIANSVECPHGIIWLGLAVVKRDEKMLDLAVSEMVSLMDLPPQFTPLAQQLTRQIINLPVSSLKLSHSLYALMPEHETMLLEYDDILVPLVQCALSRTFSEKALTDALRRVVHEELADRLRIDPNILRRGFSLGWSLKKNDRVAAYQDAAAIMNDLLPLIPEQPKSVRSLYLCGLEAFKLLTGQRHRFVDAVDAVVRRLGLDKTDLYETLSKLLQCAELSATPGDKRTKRLDFDLAIASANKAIDSVAGANEQEGVPAGGATAAAGTASAAPTAVLKARATGSILMKELAQLVAVRFSLSPEQTNELLGMYGLVCGQRCELEELPEDLQMRASIDAIYNAAFKVYDRVVECKDDEAALDDLAEKLADSANTVDHEHEWFEVWLSDQWLALDDLFAFRQQRRSIADLDAMAKLCGVDGIALRLLRELCNFVPSVVKFLFPDAKRFETRDADGNAGFFVADPKLEEDELVPLLEEIANLVLSDVLPPDTQLTASFVRTVRKTATSEVAKVASMVSNNAAATKKQAISRRQKTKELLERLSDIEDEEAFEQADSYTRELITNVGELFIEHTFGEGLIDDVTDKLKQLILFLGGSGRIPLDKIPYAHEAESVDAFFDDLVDWIATDYGTGNGEFLDIDLADTIGIDKSLLRLFGGPNKLIRNVPGLESLSILMTLLHDVDLTRAGATEVALRQLLFDLGVHDDEIAEAKLLLLFYSKRGTSLILDEEYEDEISEEFAEHLRFAKDAYLKAIEQYDENHRLSVLTLMYDRLHVPGSDSALPLAIVLEACRHYQRLRDFLDYKVFPEGQEDIEYARNARTKAAENAKKFQQADDTRSSHQGSVGTTTQLNSGSFEATVAQQLFDAVQFFCPHLHRLFEEAEAAHFAAEQRREQEEKEAKDAATARAAEHMSPTESKAQTADAGDDGDTGDTTHLLLAPSPRPIGSANVSPQSSALAGGKENPYLSTSATPPAPPLPGPPPLAQSSSPKGPASSAPTGATMALKNGDKLKRLHTLVVRLLDSNPVIDMYIEKFEGGDDESSISVDADDVPLEVMDSFRSMSPFELIGGDIHPMYRETFGVMSGFTPWFPSDFSSKFYAACTAAALGWRTELPTLQVLATVAPMKHQSLALELLRLSCRHRAAPVLSIACFLDVTVGEVEDARDLFYPPTTFEVYTQFIADKEAGRVSVDSSIVSARPLFWLRLLQAGLAGNVFAFLLLPELRDSHIMVKFGLMSVGGSYKDVIVDLFPDVDGAEVAADDEEDMANETELARMLPVLTKKMETLFLLEDEEDMWMDATELAESKQMRKVIELMLGVVWIGRSRFDYAEKHLLTFTSGDAMMTALVDILLLAARLIAEDGAVADSHAIIGAIESVARIAVVHFQRHPMSARHTEKHPKVAFFIAKVLPYLADVALDLYNEYEEGAVDELDPYDEADAVRNASRQDKAVFAAEALANVGKLEDLDWMTEQFEELRTLIETMQTDIEDNREWRKENLIDGDKWRPFPDGPVAETPIDGPRIEVIDSRLQELIDAQIRGEDLLYETPEEGEEAELPDLRSLFTDVEDMLECLAAFNKEMVPYTVELVNDIEEAVKFIIKQWRTLPQHEALNRLELSMEITPELLETVHVDLARVKKFVPGEESVGFDAACAKIMQLTPMVVEWCKGAAEDLLADGIDPDPPTADNLVAFAQIAESMDSAMLTLNAITSDDPVFSSTLRDLRKTQSTFTRNADLFCEARVVFPLGDYLMGMRSLNERLQEFQDDTMCQLSKFLKDQDGSAVRQLLRSVVPLVAESAECTAFIKQELHELANAPANPGKKAGNRDKNKAAEAASVKISRDVDESIAILDQFLSSSEALSEAPALETILEEALKLFELVDGFRNERRLAAGSSFIRPAFAGDSAATPSMAGSPKTEALAAATQPPAAAVPVSVGHHRPGTAPPAAGGAEDDFADALSSVCHVNDIGDGQGLSIVDRAKRGCTAVLDVLAGMDAGSDSGAGLILELLKLVVRSRSSAIQARKANQNAVPLTSADLRKITILLELANGKFEIVPEVIAAIGVGIPPEKQQQLIQLIRLIQSIKTIAQKKNLAALTASDTIDIIAMQMFNEFDIEGRGEMSSDVFCMALARMQLKLSAQEQRLLFSKADRDGSGFVTQSEFRSIIDDIQQRFRDRMVAAMGLSREDIYLFCAWITTFLVFLFAFIVIGVHSFADGSDFTATITALLPMGAGIATTLKDPNALVALLQQVDAVVKTFFEILIEE